jgi:hypothetical protein
MRFGLVPVIAGRVVCVIALWLCIINNASAQDSYHQLTAGDFRGIPQATGDNAIAFTHCSIDFRYHATGENNRYHLTFDVRLILDREQSWLNMRQMKSQQMLTEILKHEQGHYFIAYMEQQEILREASRSSFDANYQAEANALFDRIHTKYEQLNLNYDEDTRHSLDRVQQHSWDVYFERRLAYMPPVERVGY